MNKILFISSNDHIKWGGSEVLWSETALKFSKLDNYEVSFYAKYWDDEPVHYSKLRAAGCKVSYRQEQFEIHSLSCRERLLNRFLPQRLKMKSSRRDLWFDFIQQQNPDYIIISLGNHNDGLAWTEIARKLNIRYILICQLVNDIHFPENDFKINLISNQYINAFKIYFTSKQNKELLKIQCANNLNNSEVIFNPFEIKDYIKYPNYDKGFNLAFIANFQVLHKGHDILFKVLSDDKWKNRNLYVNLYGAGVHEEYLKKLIKYLGLKNVNLIGFELNKDLIWRKNHGLILPSRMEGMSLALLETLGVGRIVITTSVGGAKEVIENGVTGFISSGIDPEMLDKTLENAWRRRYDWEEIGKLAREKIQEKIPENSVELFVKKLNILLDND